MEWMAAARFVIQGRVQGVGFRAYVVSLAEGYGVKGEVWNRADGGVECIAQHEEPAVLDAMQAEFRFGPGRVDSVRREAFSSSSEYGDFRVTHLI